MAGRQDGAPAPPRRNCRALPGPLAGPVGLPGTRTPAAGSREGRAAAGLCPWPVRGHRVHATFSRVSTSVCPLCMTITLGLDPPQRPRLNGTRLRQPRSKRGPFLRCEGQDSRV